MPRQEAVQSGLFTTIAGTRRERERRAGSEVERSGREEVHHTEQQVELMETLGVYTREEKQPA